MIKLPDDLTPEQKARAEAFCSELQAIVDKYRVSIGGCGCCGSPWLSIDGYPRSISDADVEYAKGDHAMPLVPR